MSNETVLHTTGNVTLGSYVPHSCQQRRYPYEIDLYVDLGDLSNYAVRNYSERAPVEVCAA